MKTSVILGHPRSGSSELTRAICDAAGKSYLMEPFHSPMRKRNISFDSPEFPAYLAKIMDQGNVVKHMWNGLTHAENARVLTHPNVSGIVFIYRRDVVQAALSAVVAQMTGTWRGNAGTIDKPLPLAKIAERAKIYSEGQQLYREYIKTLNVPIENLAYEEVFVEDVSQRTDCLTRACATFGLPIEDLEAGLDRLSPDKRYNSDQFYSCAPNWDKFLAMFHK